MTDIDVIEFNRRAVDRSIEIVSHTTTNDLERATPCSEWTLRQLLEHMIVQHHGFARAATGEVTTLADWAPKPLSDDPVSEYKVAAEAVKGAFAVGGVLEQEFLLPEITSERTFVGREAVGFHFVDYVVHGWDAAKALGIDAGYDDDVVAAVLPYGLAVPDGQARTSPKSMFAPPLSVSPDATTLDRLVAYLGRDPGWPG